LGGPVLAFVRRFPIWTAIGVFALVGYIFRDFMSGSVADLNLGDCVDLPGLTANTTVKDVQHHPCSDSHHGEVFFIGTVPSGPSGANPGAAAFDSFMSAQCIPAFRSYTGLDYESDKTYDIEFLTPTNDGWAKGDHTIDCFVVRVDGQTFKGSVRIAP
jgi:hypothetical protein